MQSERCIQYNILSFNSTMDIVRWAALCSNYAIGMIMVMFGINIGPSNIQVLLMNSQLVFLYFGPAWTDVVSSCKFSAECRTTVHCPKYLPNERASRKEYPTEPVLYYILFRYFTSFTRTYIHDDDPVETITLPYVQKYISTCETHVPFPCTLERR